MIPVRYIGGVKAGTVEAVPADVAVGLIRAGLATVEREEPEAAVVEAPERAVLLRPRGRPPKGGYP